MLPPLLFTLLALVAARSIPRPSDDPSRTLTQLPPGYGAGVTLWYTTTSPDGTTSQAAKDYAKAIASLYANARGQNTSEVSVFHLGLTRF